MITDSYIEDDRRLQVERLEDGKRKLLRDLPLNNIHGFSFVIPEGFETDYSSVPFFARFLFRWSEVDIAGVVHDWLYHQNKKDKKLDSFLNLLSISGKNSEGYKKRLHADNIWYWVAISGVHHVSKFTAWLGWFGLRLGGWYRWNRSADQ
ncbi:MAG: DUF1353 domain-containing protein [Anaerolineae bacterium]